MFNGSCDNNTRCDTKLGTTQGTCQPVAPTCVGKSPGPICNDAARGICDEDLLQYSPSDCPSHAHCDDDDDDVRCVCDRGYGDDGQGGCVEIDECASAPCGPGGTCTDALDTHSCTCAPGFTGTGTTVCADVDECLTNNGGCDALVECDNTAGGRLCGACPPGYRGDGVAGCIRRWTQQFGTAGAEVSWGVTADGSGRVAAAGWLSAGLDGNNSLGGRDLFIVQYSPAGERNWARQLGSTANDEAYGIASDASGNVYVIGETAGLLDGQAGVGASDYFVVKYDGSGQKQWTLQQGTTASDGARAVTLDASGSIYVVGVTGGNLDGNTTLGSFDAFIAEYDGSGQTKWAKQLGSSAIDSGTAVAADATGHVFVAGTTEAAVDGNNSAGGQDAFVAKYDGTGQKLWTRQLGTSLLDYPSALAADAAGHVYVVGHTYGAFDGHVNVSGVDLFVVKYDSTGQKLWTRQLGSANSLLATTEDARAVAVDAGGGVYVVGNTSDLGIEDNTGGGGVDVLIVKYDGTGQKQWVRQFGGAFDDVALSAALDPSGNLYVTGHTKGPLDGNVYAGDTDAFIIKYDASGNRL